MFPSCRRRALPLVVALVCAAVLPASAVAQAPPAPSSSFTQLAGAAGCFMQPSYGSNTSGCTTGRALMMAESVVLSPDQKHVYVVASGTNRIGSNAITTFTRDATTGALTRAGCVSDDGGDGRPGTDGACTDVDALLGPVDLAFTPDGRFLYVASAWANGMAWFERDPDTGALTQRGCVKEVPRSDRCKSAAAVMGLGGVAVSPDGGFVYATARDSDSVVTFAREPETGALTQVQCISDNGSDGLCVNGVALRGASSVTVAPDGASVYVTASLINALTTYARDPSTGLLTLEGCLLDDAPPGGPCRTAPALTGAVNSTLSPDGKHLYVAATNDQALSIFNRDPATGALSSAGCLVNRYAEGDDRIPDEEDEDEDDEDEDSGDDEDEEEEEDPDARAAQSSDACAPAKALASPSEIVVSGDGRTLFAATSDSVVAFERDAGTGALRQTGCAENYRTYVSCLGDLKGVSGASGIATTVDGRNLYVTSRWAGSVAVFGSAVAITSRIATVSRTGTARIALACPRARREGCAGRVGVPGKGANRPGYRLAAGRRTTVTIRLPRTKRRSLGRGSRVRIEVRAQDVERRVRAASRRLLVRPRG